MNTGAVNDNLKRVLIVSLNQDALNWTVPASPVQIGNLSAIPASAGWKRQQAWPRSAPATISAISVVAAPGFENRPPSQPFLAHSPRFLGHRLRRCGSQDAGEIVEEFGGELLRGGIDQPPAKLGQLAADLRIDLVVQDRGGGTVLLQPHRGAALGESRRRRRSPPR